MLKTRVDRVRDWLVSRSVLYGSPYERIIQARSSHFLLQGSVVHPVVVRASECPWHALLHDPIALPASAGRLYYACVRVGRGVICLHLGDCREYKPATPDLLLMRETSPQEQAYTPLNQVGRR